MLHAEATSTASAAEVPEPAEVKDLQAQIDLVVRERDALQCSQHQPGKLMVE